MRVRELPCWGKGMIAEQYVFKPVAAGNLSIMIRESRGVADELIASATAPKRRVDMCILEVLSFRSKRRAIVICLR